MATRGNVATRKARRGRIPNSIKNAANPQAEYYRSGGASAFGGGTIREVRPGGGTKVVRGTAKS